MESDHNRPVKRSESIFYKMRIYHNWIKRNLISKYAKNAASLLDLSCGKGGDLDKWIANRIKYVIGYDINAESVKEAQFRLNEKYLDDNMKVDFRVLDLAQNVIPLGTFKFDVVTSMFAFHYMFAAENTFRTILATIKNNLKIGGYFLGCLFDNQAVDNLLGGSRCYESEDGSFIMARKTTPTQTLFGNEIEVFMNETVLDEPTSEYLVDFPRLVEVLNNEGLSLVESSMFDKDHEIWKSRTGDNLSDTEKSISFLNRTFVFKRIG